MRYSIAERMTATLMTTQDDNPRPRRRIIRPRGVLIRYLPILIVACVLLVVVAPRVNEIVEFATSVVNLVGGEQKLESVLAPFFTPEVKFWEEDIVRWAAQSQLDPNLVATVIQIESCGDPMALSIAGAQGLMQVMPQHFAGTEDPLDPDTNARRGLGVMTECLYSSYNPNADVGLAFACYNGGPSVFVNAWDYWPQQSRDYYIWGTQIYADALVRQPRSETLERWLTVGGAQLCVAARQSIGLTPEP